MKRNWVSIGTYVCPYCDKKQTAFIYMFNSSGQIVKNDTADAVGFRLGFHCITPSCGKLITGIDLYNAGDLTVGDIKNGKI